ncbi:MAG TPA: hypothetical protein VGE98_04460, partial [Thermoanaerobaculia bacterium]
MRADRPVDAGEVGVRRARRFLRPAWALAAGLAVVAALALGAPALAQSAARQVGERQDVTIVELTGGYDASLPDGRVNAEPRESVASEFFRTHPDRYDFLLVFTTFDFATDDALAFHLAVRNDVRGIGKPLFDHSADFGSAGRLQSYVDLANLAHWPADPLAPEFEKVLTVGAHELLHRW